MATIKVGGGTLNVADHHRRDAVSFTATITGDQTAYTWGAWIRYNPLLTEATMVTTTGVFAAGVTTVTVDLPEPVALDIPVGIHRWRLWKRFAGRTKTVLSGEWETVPADG